MIFHVSHNDLDGVSCAVLVSRKVPTDQYKPIFCDHYSINDVVSKCLDQCSSTDQILVTDISPGEKVIKKILDKKIDFHVVDHHKTNTFLKYKYPEYSTFNTAHSATRLVLEYTLTRASNLNTTDSEEEYALAVDAWDTWDVKSKFRTRGENLNNLLLFFGTNEYLKYFSGNVNTDLKNPFCANILEYLKANQTKYVDRIIKSQISNEIYMDDFGNTFRVFVATEHISNVGHAALNHPNNEGVSYVAVVNPNNNTVSLRSEIVDVGEIARNFGGGGHAKASGFHRDMTKLLRNHTFKVLNRTIQPTE